MCSGFLVFDYSVSAFHTVCEFSFYFFGTVTTVCSWCVEKVNLVEMAKVQLLCREVCGWWVVVTWRVDFSFSLCTPVVRGCYVMYRGWWFSSGEFLVGTISLLFKSLGPINYELNVTM